ncbi:MAG: S9 family peptidase [Thermoanaerobaculia bacterium]|nr:MAG: S9 family peptidase [Thermoanaerobaculia bacterium]
MSACPVSSATAGELRPPAARKVPHQRTLHGERFEDPWFWLRERDSAEVRAYLEAENAYTDAVMAPTAALQERLYGELVARMKEDDESVPYRRGGWRYFTRTVKGAQHKIHLRRPLDEGPEQVLLDLNELGRAEKYIALGAFEPSDDGTRLAYSLDTTGFREYALHVVDLASGRPLAAPVRKATSVAWAADGGTLFYTVEDAAKRSYRVYRLKLGAEAPELVYEEGDERFTVRVERARSGAWIFLAVASHTTSEVRLIDAAAPGAEPRLVEPRTDGHEYDLDHSGGSFYVRSNAAGRNFALYEAPVAAPGRASWKLLRAHDPGSMLVAVQAFARHLVLTERAAALTRFRVVELPGGADHLVAMPEAAYAAYPGPNEVFEASAFRYLYESPTTPDSVLDYHFAERRSELLKRDEVPGYDGTRYEVARIEATAGDGARVPVTLVHRRGLALDGRSPALLRGYGAYGYPQSAGFDPNLVSLLDRGFVAAIAHVRGGGDLGKPWHDQGRMAAKMNTFTDFVACAEELVRRGYTAPERLAITGGSAGGLLMGAVTNLRPELFAVVLTYVPFVDVINTMLDDSLPLTVGEFEEWGNPQIPEQYGWMRAYSPYENLAAKAYPAMLVRTSFWDSQVMYWEPAKYVARLRTLKTDSKPLLFKVNMDAGGHGGFAGRYDRLRDVAFDYAFLLTQLGIEPAGR